MPTARWLRADTMPPPLVRGDAGDLPRVGGDPGVDGARRYRFEDREVVFLGYGGRQLDEYVVGVYAQGRPASHRVVRVTPADDRTVVLEGVSVNEIVLSADGEQLYRPSYRTGSKTSVVKVWNGEDGTLEHTRRFSGYVDVLDAFEGRAVLSSSSPLRTFWWDTADDSTQRIADRNGYEADIRSNRLAAVNGDPYQGGCSIVSTLTRPAQRLWKSCHQAVASFSPSGDRIVTTHLLADGLGPVEYQLREVGGRHVRTFTTYYFGHALWEADEVLLLLAHGKEKSAWVRCDEGGDCERTSRLRKTL